MINKIDQINRSNPEDYYLTLYPTSFTEINDLSNIKGGDWCVDGGSNIC